MSELSLERAFELARSGSCKEMGGLERQLKKDDYAGVAQHLSDRALPKQLQAIIKPAPQA